MPYLAVLAIVFGINLLPAFGPPTWAVLVFTRLHWHLNPVALVLIGAVAASCGRFLLALAARHFGGRLPSRMRRNIEDARSLLERRRRGAFVVFTLFVVSPLPSAQLFIAAGLLGLDLVVFTVAFLIGRLVSYSIYVSVATIADKHFGNVFKDFLGSPWSIALQVVLLGALWLLPLINWRNIGKHPAPSDPG